MNKHMLILFYVLLGLAMDKLDAKPRIRRVSKIILEIRAITYLSPIILMGSWLSSLSGRNIALAVVPPVTLAVVGLN